MSDLQISLIILGLMIIVAVIIYNWRQEKQLRNRISHDFIIPKKDVLVDVVSVAADASVEGDCVSSVVASELSAVEANETPIETQTVLANAEDAVVEQSSTITEANEPAEIEVDPVQAPAKQSAPKATEPIIGASPMDTLPTAVHTHVDFIAVLEASQPINGHAFVDKLQATFHDAELPVLTHVLGKDHQWNVITATGQSESFNKISCSLQLADRRGPVSSAQIKQFQHAIESIGHEFEAVVEWKGEGDPVQRAIDLDAFCIKVDQLVSLHLIQGQTPIHGTKFKGLAEANDMKLHDGKFCCFDDKHKEQPLFTLINLDQQAFTADALRVNIVRGATFQIEVPKLINCEQTFNRVVLIAQQMAGSMGAQIVDDNQRPLGMPEIEKIREQLKRIHTAMMTHEIVPGSQISQRLFS